MCCKYSSTNNKNEVVYENYKKIFIQENEFSSE